MKNEDTEITSTKWQLDVYRPQILAHRLIYLWIHYNCVQRHNMKIHNRQKAKVNKNNI